MNGTELHEPTIGEIVHYRAAGTGERCWPALIVHIWPNRLVNLTAFDPNGMVSAHTSVSHEGRFYEHETWHWPGRHGPALEIPARPDVSRETLAEPTAPVAEPAPDVSRETLAEPTAPVAEPGAPW